jgi:hypothetical protein
MRYATGQETSGAWENGALVTENSGEEQADQPADNN